MCFLWVRVRVKKRQLLKFNSIYWRKGKRNYNLRRLLACMIFLTAFSVIVFFLVNDRWIESWRHRLSIYLANSSLCCRQCHDTLRSGPICFSACLGVSNVWLVWCQGQQNYSPQEYETPCLFSLKIKFSPSLSPSKWSCTFPLTSLGHRVSFW